MRSTLDPGPGDGIPQDHLRKSPALARRTIDACDGRLVKLTGDGVMATFDGPGRRVLCATALRDEVRTIGIDVRAGLHTGEIEIRQEDLGGLTVHIAARVMYEAGPGEVLVSRTVKDLLSGADITLADRGMRRLKGVDGEWNLSAIG